jgi:hypothetical protein
MSLIKTNDLKKGTRVLLTNGWYATIEDNGRGNTRLATVEGYVTEMGSIYAHDIARAEVAGTWVNIGLTPQQLQCKERASFF